MRATQRLPNTVTLVDINNVSILTREAINAKTTDLVAATTWKKFMHEDKYDGGNKYIPNINKW